MFIGSLKKLWTSWHLQLMWITQCKPRSVGNNLNPFIVIAIWKAEPFMLHRIISYTPWQWQTLIWLKLQIISFEMCFKSPLAYYMSVIFRHLCRLWCHWSPGQSLHLRWLVHACLISWQHAPHLLLLHLKIKFAEAVTCLSLLSHFHIS